MMSNGVSFADVVFVLFVGGVIYFFVYWFGPARKTKRMDDQQQHEDPPS